MTDDAALYDLDMGSRGFPGVGGTCGYPVPFGASCGRKSAPADLAGFLATRTVGQVADALQLSRGTAHRLVQGYWPTDARRILRAWAEYKGRAASMESGWFLRRVRDGAVRHAGVLWTCDELLQRTGQTVACTKSGTALLAQTLELPPQRLLLTRVEV